MQVGFALVEGPRATGESEQLKDLPRHVTQILTTQHKVWQQEREEAEVLA